MLEKIALIMDFAPFAVIFLIVVCYNTHAIPRAMAKRISRREDSWDKDTVEEDRLGVLLFLTPAFGFAVPGLFRLVTGLFTPVAGELLLMGGAFAAFVLVSSSTPLLRYDTMGVHVRVGFGKTVFLPWHQITSVQWQLGKNNERQSPGSRPLTPVVAIYYTASLFGRPTTEVCYLEPTTHRGISRFLAMWNTRHPEEVLSNFEE